jgi:carboxyl-terminal processing protease
VQDFGVGKIIGTKSYGKGIVQTVVPLTDGSAIKLTIEKYYTPKGRNIHGKGITPDIKVEQPENAKKDVQLKKALTVLRKEK